MLLVPEYDILLTLTLQVCLNMKIKILKFKDGRTAVSVGLHVEINKQKPTIETEIDVSEEEVRNIIEKPHEQAEKIKDEML